MELCAAPCAQPAGFHEKRHHVPLFFPWRVVGEPLVRQGGQAKAGVGNADPLRLIREHFCGNVDQRAHLWLDHLTSSFAAVDEHQAGDAKGRIAVAHCYSRANRSCNDAGLYSEESSVGLSDRASRKLVVLS
jgi:hypothetical protein